MVVRMAVGPPVLVGPVDVVELVRPGGIPGHVQPTPVGVDALQEMDVQFALVDRIVLGVVLYQRLFIEGQVPDISHYVDVRRPDVPFEFFFGDTDIP